MHLTKKLPALGSRWSTRQRRNVYTVQRIEGEVVHCTLSVQGLREVTAQVPLARFATGRLDSLVQIEDVSAPPPRAA